MPTYEYECTKCGKIFELFQSITERPINRCKFCKGRVNRLIGTGGGIIFKGNGFYATDYKKNGKDSKTPTEKKESPSCPAKEGGSCADCSKSA